MILIAVVAARRDLKIGFNFEQFFFKFKNEIINSLRALKDCRAQRLVDEPVHNFWPGTQPHQEVFDPYLTWPG